MERRDERRDERVNVALTRAKCKLILVASVEAMRKASNSTILKQLVNFLQHQGWIYSVNSY